MNLELQIKAIAELDDVKIFQVSQQNDPGFQIVLNTGHIPKSAVELKPSEWPDHWVGQKDYLTSRDAIVPVIEKQMKSYGDELTFWTTLQRVVADGQTTPYSIDYRCIIATPSQLCEALLRATGKWIE